MNAFLLACSKEGMSIRMRFFRRKKNGVIVLNIILLGDGIFMVYVNKDGKRSNIKTKFIKLSDVPLEYVKHKLAVKEGKLEISYFGKKGGFTFKYNLEEILALIEIFKIYMKVLEEKIKHAQTIAEYISSLRDKDKQEDKQEEHEESDVNVISTLSDLTKLGLDDIDDEE